MRPKRTVPAFELLAPYYDEYVSEIDYESWVAAYDEIARACFGRPVRSVLDVGCGTGVSSFPWKDRAQSVVGFDLSLEMLKQARSRQPRALSWVLGNLRQLPFGARRFDLVQMTFSVVNLVHPHDLKQVFKEAHRVLEHNGLLMFDVLDMQHEHTTDLIDIHPFGVGNLTVESRHNTRVIKQTYSSPGYNAILILYLHNTFSLLSASKSSKFQEVASFTLDMFRGKSPRISRIFRRADSQ